MSLVENGKIELNKCFLPAEELNEKLPTLLVYDYLIVYGMSNRIVAQTEQIDLKSLNWAETVEIRCFDARGELHGMIGDNGMQLYEIIDTPKLVDTDYLDKTYLLSSNVLGNHGAEKCTIENHGLSDADALLIRRYLEYDEDGQAQIVLSRCFGFSKY